MLVLSTYHSRDVFEAVFNFLSLPIICIYHLLTRLSIHSISKQYKFNIGPIAKTFSLNNVYTFGYISILYNGYTWDRPLMCSAAVLTVRINVMY